MKEIFIEERLIVYLMMLKITPNLKGYAYFKETVKRLCMNDTLSYRYLSELYKEIANDFNEKVVLFDRALRHAAQVSYNRNGLADFERATKITFYIDKPTARDIICILAEKIKLDLSKNNFSHN